MKALKSVIEFTAQKCNVSSLYLSLLLRFRRECIAAVLCMLLLSILQLPMPLLTMRAIDAATSGRPAEARVSVLCLLLLLVFFLVLGIRTLQRLVMERLGALLVFRVQKQIIEKSIELPLEHFTARAHGYMLARAEGDPVGMYSLITDTMLSLVSDILTLAIGIGFLLYVNWKMALLALMSFPLYGLFAWKMRIGMKTEFAAIQEKSAQLSSYLGSLFSNLVSVKTLTNNRQVLIGYLRFASAIIRQRFVILRRRIHYESIIMICSGITPILLLWLGAREIMLHRLSVGGFIAFSGYLGYLYRPAESIAIAILGTQSAVAAAERVLEIVNSPDEHSLYSQRDNGETDQTKPIEVQLHNLSYRYPNSREWTLQNISCSFHSGEITAIVGNSGDGKSTLVNLIPRLIIPTSGRINILGLKYQNLQQLRRHIALVSQETFLFPSTILDNIRAGAPESSREQVHRASEIACAAGFINELPDQYNTRIFEFGRSLSAGQRQRILIARAILRQPKILILDEATSCLDVNTEKHILNNVRQLEIPLVLVVSHRQEVIAAADRVYRVCAGAITELAFHAHLERVPLAAKIC